MAVSCEIADLKLESGNVVGQPIDDASSHVLIVLRYVPGILASVCRIPFSDPSCGPKARSCRRLQQGKWQAPGRSSEGSQMTADGGVLMTMHRMSQGGADRVAVLIANGFQAAGMPVDFLLLRSGGEGEEALLRLIDPAVRVHTAGPPMGSRHLELVRGIRSHSKTCAFGSAGAGPRQQQQHGSCDRHRVRTASTQRNSSCDEAHQSGNPPSRPACPSEILPEETVRFIFRAARPRPDADRCGANRSRSHLPWQPLYDRSQCLRFGRASLHHAQRAH